MRPLFWVTAVAVLSLAWAKNSTANAKPKRQLDNIRTPQNLQYSLVLPHSRVAHFRALTSSRRISNVAPRGGKLPPYAVQMEPVVQYSQKDPLYDPTLDHLDDAVNKNELYAQAKILNVHDQQTDTDQLTETVYGPPYGSFPTAPLYGHDSHPQYYHESPEPIIEIIIKESNESLPAPPPLVIPKKKKEPVQVFYVKYSKDPYSHDKVVYDKPIAAITPPSNDEDEHHHDDYVTVTPEPLYQPLQTTTLRALIKPESEVYHSDSSVKVTFGSDHSHHGGHYTDRKDSNGNAESHEETAPKPAIAYPQSQPSQPPLGRSVNPNSQYHEPSSRPAAPHPSAQPYRPAPQHAQSRIQFQQPFLPNEQQLPRQGPSVSPFRTQSHVQRPFGGPGPLGFPNPSPGPNNNQFGGSSISGPAFGSASPRLPSFHPRPSNPPAFAPRPNHFNSPPRTSFHSGPQRPFQAAPQQQQYFDDPKYLQDNYHTITTDQFEQSKDQLPNRPPQNFNFLPRPSPGPSPSSVPFQDHNRPQHIPLTQQLPQQRPPQQFIDTHIKPAFPVTPSRSPFYNLKPSPPHLEENKPPTFLQHQPPFGFNHGSQPHNRFPGSVGPTLPSVTSPQSPFLPQPSPTPQFSFHPQPSSTPERPLNIFHQQAGPSERPPHFHQQLNPSERPTLNHQDEFQGSHQQNIGPFVPHGGELVAAIPKYEQHITINGPTAQPQPDFSGLSQPSPNPNQPGQIYRQEFQQQTQQQTQHQLQHQVQHHSQQQDQHRGQHDQQQTQHQPQQVQHHSQQQEQHRAQQQEQHRAQQQEQHRAQQQEQHRTQKQEQQRAQHDQQQLQQQTQQQPQQHVQQQFYDPEQEQVRQQLAQNVKKQQEEIQRLQQQLIFAQQQQQQQLSQPYQQNYKFGQINSNQLHSATSAKPQYSQERSRAQYSSSTTSPPYYQSTSRTVEIKPTTQKYASSTINSINSTPESKKQEKKRPQIELPDEVPDDLRQQLLSSGILDNADISVLDYDKVGDTPLDSLPPDQLANFFSAGGGQQIASSEIRPIVVTSNGERVESKIDDIDDDQEPSASENVPSYVAAPSNKKREVEMKVVHFDPSTVEGQKIAKDYVKEDATRLDTVSLNDKKYNRYLPLKVSGNQFPLPDVLKGRKVSSVVVLAPVETELLTNTRTRTERAAENLKGIKFLAGDSLYAVLKKPTTENFKKWLDVEKKTLTDQQSVILLVTGDDDVESNKEIFMYDVETETVNKLNGDLSNAFVDAAENNSLSRDIEKLAIEGDGTPETFEKKPEEDNISDGSQNVPLFVDISGLRLDQGENTKVSISSGYSKTKLGRSLRRQ